VVSVCRMIVCVVEFSWLVEEVRKGLIRFLYSVDELCFL
jgi:hypothetical protein